MGSEAVSTDTEAQNRGDAGELEQGTYEVLRARLDDHAGTLRERAEALNRERLDLFGGAEMTVAGNERIRTENNCVPRDIRTVGGMLLFGYNVYLGLRTETDVDDVFSLHTFRESDPGHFAFDAVPADDPRNFLHDKGFVREFKELYKYYKDTRLLQLRLLDDGKLLAIFRVGASADDVKVFRWAVDPQGKATYIDNRGERDHVLPPSHGFEWTPTTRDDHVLGRHPHVSIRDKVFVETVGGDLTVKVEDNTEDGLGIYREDVDEPHQSLADAEILFAEVGTLILIKVRPYNETQWRHLVFNTRTQTVDRIDAIGQACHLLPEDHGLIFPGGFYLQDGTTKSFDGDVDDMELLRIVRSPNGEDVLYAFHERTDGRTILLNYNLIRKQVQNPIHCHGWALFEDGKMVIFRSTSEEPTRVHPMQVWQTPFVSDEHAAKAPTTGSFLEKVGNAELVRGISDALSVSRSVSEQAPTVAGYEDLIASTVRMADAYYWLGDDGVGDLADPLGKLRETADLIVGEFEKVQAMKAQAEEAVAGNEEAAEELFHRLRAEPRNRIDHYVHALADLRTRRGKLMSLREMRYVDLDRVAALETRIVDTFDDLSAQTVDFLLAPEALQPYHDEIGALEAKVDGITKTADARPLAEGMDDIGDGLELLTEVVGGLKIDDPTQRTGILENISEVLSALNRGRALVQARRKELAQREGTAEFGAQFQLLSQSVSGALALADSPEACDEQLSKLMLQLEDLESRFGELDDPYLDQLATKREDVYEAFSTRKQALLDERQRRAGRMMQAAERILDGIRRRASALADVDALNTYFVGDAMVAKVRDLSTDLRGMGDSVRADELESRLKSCREDAARALRDRRDIFEGGAEVLRLGRQRFSVNTQTFDLTMVPRKDRAGDTEMAFHLTGTDFYETVDDADFADTQAYWDQLLVSETPEVYRGEFLAASMLFDAEQGRSGLSLEALREAALAPTDGDGGKAPPLLDGVRGYAAERYEEGYERGLHDHDAALILEQLLALYATAGLLRFAPRPRALACLFWGFFGDPPRRVTWERRARSLARLRDAFAHSPAIDGFVDELAVALGDFLEGLGIELPGEEARMAGAYLFEELSHNPPSFTTSAEAQQLRDAFLRHLDLHQNRRDFDEDLRELENHLDQRYHLALAWLRAFLDQSNDPALGGLAPSLEEAVVLLLTERRLERTVSSALSGRAVEGLLGQHPRISGRNLELRLDEFLARLTAYRRERAPGFRRFQQLRHRLLEHEREMLRLDEYRPKVMSAFVRNKLINDVYLPLIGDNLAKQMGTIGEGKRTDQMGLLLLVSPPGYGKTTLMEYVANRLGLVFVKVNGPALGHGVTSLDPAEAPNATARQEVEKIDFALEMGNNVLLYLDDIQHTHPELLQKFISLCDAQRRIEGVWRGRTRTYDLKGKRFAVCMAGNPYTESGEKFQIPDMLANRADTYNLGDILEGKGDVFALSYIENALTSNATLAPLTTREQEDVYELVRMAREGDMRADRLRHAYSPVELEQILTVLTKLNRIQEVVLTVNQQYILSAAQDDAFRTEPKFQLQGSYRNMNKMAEKVVAVMNEVELEALIDDHYNGEAQTLTSGAEANLLKLAELRGSLSESQRQRWGEIQRGFARVQAMGGAEDDPAVKLIGQLGLMSDRLSDIDRAIATAAEASQRDRDRDSLTEAPAPPSFGPELADALAPYVEHLKANLTTLAALQGTAGEISAGDEGEAATAEALVALLADRLDPFLERLGDLVAQVGRAAAIKAHPAEPTGPTSLPPASPPPKPPAPLPAEPLPPEPPSAEPAVQAPQIRVDFGPYLEKLDATLGAMAQAQGARVVQTLGAGVHDVLDDLAESVAGNLLPLVQALETHMKDVGMNDRRLTGRLDRALANLDRMKGLLTSLRKIDTSGLAAG